MVKDPPAKAGNAGDKGSTPELPFSSPGDFPDPGIEPGSPQLQVDSLPSEQPGKPIRHSYVYCY